ncbi:MAG: transposase, partial [Bradymonadaceae bacterium]|nr:transposase [Lujinxingiaceae bacterium]
MIIALVDETLACGARLEPICEVLGLTARTLQRWRGAPDGQGVDGRRGPHQSPKNKIADKDKEHIMALANSDQYRNLGPNQIVPLWADAGWYLCSESTLYRFLKEAEQLTPRGRQNPATRHKPAEKKSCGPNQLWCWDISYLPTIESLFRTVKYCPAYPYKGFASLEAAQTWFKRFVVWYNGEHLHSAIGYVTPSSRHEGRDRQILAQRHELYQQARRANPSR